MVTYFTQLITGKESIREYFYDVQMCPKFEINYRLMTMLYIINNFDAAT